MLIEVFVAPHGCPACGQAERLVRRVVADMPSIEMQAVDVLDAGDRVAGYRVFTTPFIVIDGRLEFTGLPSETDLRSRIAVRLVGRPST
jgi:hypothetical protein